MKKSLAESIRDNYLKKTSDGKLEKKTLDSQRTADIQSSVHTHKSKKFKVDVSNGT